MDIRQLRYFVNAVEGASLSAAAKRQSVTVQAVSKAIAELEAELGVQLLTRGNHGVSPTAIGSVFYERVRPLLDEFTELEDFTRYFPVSKDDSRMVIALCSPSFRNDQALIDRLAKMIGKRIGIALKIIITPGRESIEALRVGALDAVCTIGSYSSPDTDSLTIGNLPTGIALAKTHPLARKRSVTLEDLAPYPIIWSERFDDFNHSVHAAYRARGLQSPRELFVRGASEEQVRSFFLERDGVSFAVMLPFPQVREAYLKVLPIARADAVKVPLCLITMKDRKSAAYLALERQAPSIFHGGIL